MRPTQTPPERAEALSKRPARSRVHYPWEEIKVGEWQTWQNFDASVQPGEARTAANRLRSAARDWAKRRDMDLQTVTTREGRTVDLRFTRRSA
jgi:hypothetical protein